MAYSIHCAICGLCEASHTNDDYTITMEEFYEEFPMLADDHAFEPNPEECMALAEDPDDIHQAYYLHNLGYKIGGEYAKKFESD